MNTADYLLERSIDDTLAFITCDTRVTFGLLKRIGAHLINVLVGNNIEPGDRVAIWGPNSPYWAAAYLAVMKIGAVAVPISTYLTTDSLKSNMTFTNCKFLFIDRILYNKNKKNLTELQLYILDNNLLDLKPANWPSLGTDFDIDVDAALMFTSGTTALPRAVRITHRNIQANTESIIEYLELNSDDRIMVVLPFFYCFGTSLLHTHLRVGASLVLSQSFVYPETVLDLMETTSCTGFAGVPTTYQTLLRNSTFKDRKLSALRKIQQAGGKLHDTLIRELYDSHPQAKVYVMYGQTEATARLSFLPPELLSTKLGSIGKGIPGVKLSVVSEEDRKPIYPGEIGEIIAEGDNISPGYLNDPDASLKKFCHGVLYTGDIATNDDEGYIYIVDRKSDFIKSYGHRISSYEIETSMLKIVDVVGVAVVGIPDEYAGEKIIAFVILSDRSMLTVDNIMDYCHTHLPRYMCPQEIVFTKSFPLNAHGKVIKSELRKSRTR